MDAKRYLLNLTMIVMMFSSMVITPAAYGFSDADRNAMLNDSVWFDSSNVTCGTNSGGTAPGSGGLYSPFYPTGANEAQLAQSIVDYITKRQPSSPLIPLAGSFVSLGKAANVNPAMAVGMSQIETSFATAGHAAPPLYNFFNVRNGPGGTFGSMPGYIGALQNYYDLISGPVYLSPPTSFTTVNEIVNKYAPLGDGANDPTAYTNVVNNAMKDILGGAGATAASGSADTGATTSGTLTSLPTSVPEPYRTLFPKAAQAFNMDLGILTTIFYTENRGFPNPPPPYGTGRAWRTSSAGAQGPFQFVPGTWAGQVAAVKTALGKTSVDILDLTDAAYGAAHFLESLGGTAGIPLGSKDNPKQRPSVIDVFASYNGGPGYPVPLVAETSQYIDIATKFYLALTGGSLGTTPTICGGGGGGIGIGTDGFVFPQRTTKSALKAAGFNVNCVNTGPIGQCHHDYLAADIFNSTGTPVVAARPGRVVSAHDGGNISTGGGSIGMTVRIYSDTALGGDGLWYYYAHMLKPQESPAGGLKVKDGDIVTAGQDLGVVGTDADAEGTPSHTHFDVSPVENSFHRGHDGSAGPLLDPYPALRASYANLPD